MASTTTTFLKSRVSMPTLDKWSSGFSAVKKYAEENNVPFIAVWSNGDACGHCVNLEKAVMNKAFVEWMETSNCVFWFGCSSDKTTDDKQSGTGFKWAKKSKLKTYPFVRVYWKNGNVDVAESGDYWINSSAKGYDVFINKLTELLKDYKPNGCINCEDVTETECENCTDDCEQLKKGYTALKAKYDKLLESYNEAVKLQNNYKDKLNDVQNKLSAIVPLLNGVSENITDIQDIVIN